MIAAGHSHSGCISESAPARVYMWGSNSDCRLMTEENENKYLPSLTLLEKLRIRDQDSYEPCFLSLGVTHSALITRSGDLFTSGSKLDGQLGLPYLPKTPPSQTFDSAASGGSLLMNQYKDPRELREIAHPLHHVDGFGPSNRAL